MKDRKKYCFYEEKVTCLISFPWEKVAFSSPYNISWVVAVENIKSLKKAYFPSKSGVFKC